jgi:chromosome segregation ATPase
MGLRMQFKNPAEAKAAHNSELDALRTQLQEVEAQLEAAQADAKDAKASTKAAQDEVAALRSKLAEGLSGCSEVERNLTNTKLELEAALSAAAEDRARHGSALASLQATHTQEIARLREELAENDQNQQRLENDLKQRSMALAEATTARKAAEEAAQTHADQSQQAAKAAAARCQAAAEAEGTRLRAETEQQRKLIADQAVELQKKQEEVIAKDNELKAALADVARHKALADSSELRVTEADQHSEKAKDEAERLARKLDEAVTALAAQHRALEEARAVSQMSQREARVACDEAAQLAAVAKAAEAQCRTTKEAAVSDYEEVSRKLEAANAEAADLRQQREAFQQQLKDSYDEAAQRSEQINALEEELKNYRAQAAAVNPAQLLLLHDKGREVQQLKKERESISNELERLQLGLAWESASGTDVAAPSEMVFTQECPATCQYPVKSPKGRPNSRGATRPRGPGGPSRPTSARRSNHAAKRTPSLTAAGPCGKMKSSSKISASDPCDSARDWNQASLKSRCIYETGTLERGD